MKKAVWLAAILLAVGVSPTWASSRAQGQDSAVEEITNACRQVMAGNSSGLNALSDTEDGRTGMAMLCSLYLEGYEDGSSAATEIDPRVPAACRRFVQVAIRGEAAEGVLMADLNRLEMSAVERLAAVQLCGYFKDGFVAGVQYYRDVMAQ